MDAALNLAVGDVEMADRDRDREGGRPRNYDGDDATPIYLERRTGDERRQQSVWQDPRTWVSILGFLLALCSGIGGLVAKQLSDLRSDVAAITRTQDKTITKQTEEIETLKGKLSKAEDRIDKDERDQNAYNYDQAKMLTAIKTKLGIQ